LILLQSFFLLAYFSKLSVINRGFYPIIKTKVSCMCVPAIRSISGLSDTKAWCNISIKCIRKIKKLYGLSSFLSYLHFCSLQRILRTLPNIPNYSFPLWCSIWLGPIFCVQMDTEAVIKPPCTLYTCCTVVS